MTKRIEEELAEMNRLKRLELEFLFFKANMDGTMLEKFRDALTTKNTISSDTMIGDAETTESKDFKKDFHLIKNTIKKVAA
ncbi:hypothetical protein [Nitrosopumilus sp. b2]|uniref:hypothetical protein n=1 Tax=Nitrosopumilus sp. b2 TaxID=2109908 RepID=UPI0015F545CD|nr:hypothetical protein [Nitrosopumilus sp. b2]KAF6244784.1 hypothetical protein C6989_06875 [Nitrosopumilus sp. b2]